MKNNKWIVTLLAVALVVGMTAVFAVGCGGDGADEETSSTEVVETTDNGQDYNFVVSVGMPSSASLYNTYLVPWTEAVTAASDGRVQFTIHSANTLVKEEQQIDAVLNGTSDITAFQPDWSPGVYPLCEFGEMPMLFPDTLVGAQVMWTLLEEYGQEELQDFHLLGIGFISAAQWGGLVPAIQPSDLEGKRVRSGGSIETQCINALGGVPVEAGTDSLATQLDRNAFDGLFLSWSFHAGNTNNWATNWTEVGLFLRPLILVMSKENWDTLPAAVQQAFNDESGIEAALKYLAVEEQYVIDNSSVPEQKDRGLDRAAVAERAASLGTEIYVLNDEERAVWKTALQPVIDDWVTNYAGQLDTEAIVARAEELTKQYSTGGSGGETTTTAAE